MKTVLIIPAPKRRVWQKIMKKYNVPDVKDHNGFCSKVVFPKGWTIEKTNTEKQTKMKNAVNLDILDENGKIIGKIFINDKMGFTWIDESVVKDVGGL